MQHPCFQPNIFYLFGRRKRPNGIFCTIGQQFFDIFCNPASCGIHEKTRHREGLHKTGRRRPAPASRTPSLRQNTKHMLSKLWRLSVHIPWPPVFCPGQECRCITSPLAILSQRNPLPHRLSTYHLLPKGRRVRRGLQEGKKLGRR